MDSIAQIISSLGFPIVACIGLGIFIKKVIENNREDAKEDKERMYKILDGFKDVLNQSVATITRINGRLDTIETKVDTIEEKIDNIK